MESLQKKRLYTIFLCPDHQRQFTMLSSRVVNKQQCTFHRFGTSIAHFCNLLLTIFCLTSGAVLGFCCINPGMSLFSHNLCQLKQAEKRIHQLHCHIIRSFSHIVLMQKYAFVLRLDLLILIGLGVRERIAAFL